MEQFNQTLTTVFGLLLVTAIGYEIRNRRKKLREVYNLLDSEDKALVSELEQMLAAGQLQRYEAV
ncbi:MAG: hypothetical protein ACKN9W_05195 [Methylococcus sp.]